MFPLMVKIITPVYLKSDGEQKNRRRKITAAKQLPIGHV